MKLIRYPLLDYRNIELNTCDIILCSGNSGLSKSIQSFQGLAGFKEPAKLMSHIACVVKLNSSDLHVLKTLLRIKYGESTEYIYTDPNSLYVFESTTYNKWVDKKGVQINPMYEFIANYDGLVFVRKLTWEVNTKQVIYFIADHINDKYENGISGFFELLFCGLMWSRFIKAKFPNWKPAASKNPHCSENVARLLKYCGLLKDIAIENRMPPAVWIDRLEVDKLHLEHATLDENILCPITGIIRIK